VIVATDCSVSASRSRTDWNASPPLAIASTRRFRFASTFASSARSSSSRPSARSAPHRSASFTTSASLLRFARYIASAARFCSRPSITARLYRRVCVQTVGPFVWPTTAAVATQIGIYLAVLKVPRIRCHKKDCGEDMKLYPLRHLDEWRDAIRKLDGVAIQRRALRGWKATWGRPWLKSRKKDSTTHTTPTTG
jgi:hypothetical protein